MAHSHLPALNPYHIFWYVAYRQNKIFKLAERKKASRLGGAVWSCNRTISFFNKEKFIEFIKTTECQVTSFTDAQFKLQNRENSGLILRNFFIDNSIAGTKFIPLTRKQALLTKADFLPEVQEYLTGKSRSKRYVFVNKFNEMFTCYAQTIEQGREERKAIGWDAYKAETRTGNFQIVP